MEHDDIMNVFVIVYEDGKVFITDVQSEAKEFAQSLVNTFTSFKFITYNSVTDYIIRA